MQKLSQLFDSALKYGTAAILLAIPLYPKFPFIRIPGTYVSIRLEDFVMLVISLVIFVKYLPKIREIFKNGIERSILIFLGISLLSLVSGIVLLQTAEFGIGALHWARRVEYFVPFFVGLLVLKNQKTGILNYFLKVLMVTVFVAFLYGLGQKYLNFPVIITQSEEYAKGVALSWTPGSHIASTFAGHYDLATFLVFTLPIFISSLFVLKERKMKVALLVVIFAGLWLLAGAISRISIASYLASTTLSLVLIKKYKAIIPVVVISILFFAFSTDLLSRYKRIIDIYAQTETALPQRRLSSETPTPTPVPVFEDRSTSIRLNVEWPRAIRAFSKNPLLGTGFSSITLATDNDYLRLLGEIGILGFFSFLLIFLRIGILALRNFPLTKHFEGASLAFVSGTIGGLAGVFLNAVFIDVFEASKFAIIFWLLMGISVSLMRNTRNEQNN